ncbi:MAG: AI-2E family transporter, partial [Nakamurella sp.]
MTDTPGPLAEDPEFITEVEVLPAPPKGGYGLPRGLIIALGLASAVVVAAGIHSIPNILGPLFMAVVLVVTLDPIRGWLIRKGAPRWLATLSVILGVYAIVIGLFAAAIVGIAQLASLMPQYADQFQTELDGIRSWLSGLGVSQSDIQNALSGIDKSSILSAAGALLKSIQGIFSSVLFLIVLVIFMGVDGSVFNERMILRRPGREPVLTALGTFAAGTRKYFGVATIFGGIVAVLDGFAL